MPATLLTFGAAEVQARTKSALLTQEINRKFVASEAPGIYRGFRLTPGAAPRTVEVQGDPERSDHAAALLTASGVNLSVRRIGNFTVDLTAFAGKRVVLALAGEYDVGFTTVSRLQAFELSPTDEFTGAAGLEVTALGTVDVPATAVPLVATDISASFRSDAWRAKSSGEIFFAPIILNSGFENARTGAVTPAESRLADGWFFSATDSYTWTITEAATHAGVRSVELAAPGPLTTTVDLALLRQFVNIPVDHAPSVRLEAFIQQPSLATVGGAIRFELGWVDKDGTDLTTTSVDFTPQGVSGAFVRFTDTVIPPTGAALLRRIELQVDDVQVGSAGVVFRVDQVQVWVQTVGPDNPYLFKEAWAREVQAGPLTLRDPDADQDSDGVQLAVDDSDPTEAFLDLQRMRDLLNDKSRDPALRMAGRLLLGSGLGDTAANAQTARVSAPVFSTSSYNLLWESASSGGRATRIYVSSLGLLAITTNAVWDEATSMWSQDIADSSMRLLLTNVALTLQHKTVSGPWAEGSWDSNPAVFTNTATLLLDSSVLLTSTLFSLFSSKFSVNDAADLFTTSLSNFTLTSAQLTLLTSFVFTLATKTLAITDGHATVPSPTTGAGGSNGPFTDVVKNELRAKSFPAMWGRVRCGNAGADDPPSVRNGFSIGTGNVAYTVSVPRGIRVTLAGGLGIGSSDDYQVQAQVDLSISPSLLIATVESQSGADFDIEIWDISGAGAPVQVDARDFASTLFVNFSVFAEQS